MNSPTNGNIGVISFMVKTISNSDSWIGRAVVIYRKKNLNYAYNIFSIFVNRCEHFIFSFIFHHN